MRGLILIAVVIGGMAANLVLPVEAAVTQNNLQGVESPRLSIGETANVSLKTAWGLSDEEISRLNVVREIAGPHVDLEMISPVELLGIYAETDEQRSQYARRYIRAQQAHRVKSMEWAITVASIAAAEASSYPSGSPLITEYSKHTDQGLDQARHEFFKGGRYEAGNPPANYTTRFATAVQQNAARAIAKRAVVYIEFDCHSCDKIVGETLGRQRSNEIPGVDVVFSGVSGDAQQKISEWAVRMGITREEVGSRSVTLNYETNFWKEQRGDRKVPLVISTGS